MHRGIDCSIQVEQRFDRLLYIRPLFLAHRLLLSQFGDLFQKVADVVQGAVRRVCIVRGEGIPDRLVDALKLIDGLGVRFRMILMTPVPMIVVVVTLGGFDGASFGIGASGEDEDPSQCQQRLCESSCEIQNSVLSSRWVQSWVKREPRSETVSIPNFSDEPYRR